MSVLIKGMEMPSRCNMCQLRDLCFDYYICRAKKLNDGLYLDVDVDDVKDRRHIKCPLVEVPTPHGRLIDADKLVWFIDNHIASGKKWVEFETIKDMINSLPTIIEAEV